MNHALSGNVEVICGPMFSGKTEELIRRVRRAQIARQKVQIFKPAIDDRYHDTKVVSHSAQEVEAQVLNSSFELLKYLLDSTRIVAIDEVQFFDNDIILVVKKLSRRGVRVICAGLDLDYKAVPFGPIPHLLAIADEVVKIQAICTVCGGPASKTFRKENVVNKTLVLIGESDSYEARCSSHYDYHAEDEEELLAFSLNKQTNPEVLKVQVQDEKTTS